MVAKGLHVKFEQIGLIRDSNPYKTFILPCAHPFKPAFD